MMVIVSVSWLILVLVTLGFFVATRLPGFGVVGLARLAGRRCFVVVVVFALAWVLPSDLWCVGSIMCVLHWCQMLPHWHLRWDDTL
jgi:hypothetical protein